jgi:hypothetical protein
MDAKCLLAATKAETNRQEQLRQAEMAQKTMNVTIVQTFAKRAREAAIAARATPEAAEEAATAAAADAEIAFAENAMQE